MPTPTDTVTDFLAMWAEPDGFIRAVERYFTADTVWENHGLATTTGAEQAIGFFRQFGAQAGIAGIRVKTTALAATGDKVLTERIDWMVDAAEQTLMEVPVMGIFEVSGDKIAAWRDYFDTKAMAGG